MRGTQDVLDARLQGAELQRIDIDLTGAAVTAGVENVDGVLVGLLLADEVDTAPRCDLRAVRGAPVAIFGPSYERAWPFFDACMEHGASRVSVLCPRYASTYDGEKVREWEL